MSGHNDNGMDAADRLEVIWCNILREVSIDRSRSFLEHGGTSMLAIAMAARIKEEFDVVLTSVEILRGPEFEAIHLLIRQRAASSHIREEAVQSGHQELPQSPYQKALWFNNALNGPNAVYNIVSALRIDGDLDRERLMKALKALLHRHEALRTVLYCDEHEALLQKVLGVDSVPIRSLQADEEGLEELVREEFEYEFHLNGESLTRISLVDVEPSGTALVLNMHHAVFDGYSGDIFLNELKEIYENDTLQSRASRASYADYSKEMASRYGGERAAARAKEKLQQLNLHEYQTSIRHDYPKPRMQQFHSAHLQFSIESAQLTALKKQAAANGCTLKHVTSALAFLTIFRSARLDSYAVGMTAANRDHVGMHDVVGYFSNVVILRMKRGTASFREFLLAMREETFRAMEDQEVPFLDYVTQSGMSRNLASNPIVQTLINWKGPALVGFTLGSAAVSRINALRSKIKFDFTFNFQLERGKLNVHLEYNRSLLRKESMERLQRNFCAIVLQLIENAEVSVTQLLAEPSDPSALAKHMPGDSPQSFSF